ncbi:MAG: flippase-like domain-containing protein [Candidatus Omnitrophica bacterium]|nr:flippase-like domain-containing protein [Candidatus Omnitrophota bacterium]
MKRRWNQSKKLVFNALRVAVSAGLIMALFWAMRGSFDEVIAAIKGSNKFILLGSFCIFIIGIILLGLRLRFIMAAQHLRITPGMAIYLTFLGTFFNNFLPTAIGGDIAKVYYASRHTGKKLSSVACIAFDRLLGTFTLVLMVLGTYIFVKNYAYRKAVFMFISIAAVISIIICLVLFSRRIARKIPLVNVFFKAFDLEEKMKGIYEIIYNYKKHPRLIFNAALISVALQSIMFYSVYLISVSLGLSLPLKLIFLFMPIISTVSMAPSINGLGVRESSFVVFFSPVIGKEGAFAISILSLGLNFGTSLIGGILYLLSMKSQRKSKEVLN